MRIVCYEYGQKTGIGAVVGERIVDLSAASDGQLPPDLSELLIADAGLEQSRRIVEEAQSNPGFVSQDSLLPVSQVRRRAPVPRPGKIVCLGLNYGDHAAESGTEIPEEPVVFCKAPTSVIGPERPIRLPAVSEKVDYEVELAVIIGRKTRTISPDDALDHVGGYTIVCDVSARDYQHEKPGGQWYLGKSFDTFCPMGPVMVTGDELADPHDLNIMCEVNGEVRQSSHTSQMIFDIPTTIAYLSQVFTLEPGDVVSTGTPAGVGAGQEPPVFLKSGDCVRCKVNRIGLLENPVR